MSVDMAYVCEVRLAASGFESTGGGPLQHCVNGEFIVVV